MERVQLIKRPPADDLEEPSSPTIARKDRRLRLTSRPFSEIEHRELTWLWEGLIPSGMLTVLWGNPGVGKSQMLTDIAARVSRGDPMPCFDGEKPIRPDGPGNVLLVSSEDDPNSVMRPRLEAAGADLKRVHLVGMVSTANPTELEPVSRLAQLAEQLEAEILRVGNVKTNWH